MTDRTPRNHLCAADLGLIILPDTPSDDGACQAVLALSVPKHNIETKAHAPWQNPSLWALMETPAWRQLLILAKDIDAYETALTLMALQKGFDVFLSCPSLDSVSESRVARLRQASAFVITTNEALAELALETGRQ